MCNSQEITFWFSERKHNRGAYGRKNVRPSPHLLQY